MVYPRGERADTVAALDRLLPGQREPWTDAEAFQKDLGVLLVNVDDDPFSGYREDDRIAAVRSAMGALPAWDVTIDISFRADDPGQVSWLVIELLSGGGVALDEYTSHCWTRQEIQNGTLIDGLRFCDFPTWRQRHPLV